MQKFDCFKNDDSQQKNQFRNQNKIVAFFYLRIIWIAFVFYERRKAVDFIFDTLKKLEGKNFHFSIIYFWIQYVHLSYVSYSIPIYLFSQFALRAFQKIVDKLVCSFEIVGISTYI